MFDIISALLKPKLTVNLSDTNLKGPLKYISINDKKFIRSVLDRKKKAFDYTIDSPEKVYTDPNNLFVAGFIGNPPMNFLETTFDGEKLIDDNLLKNWVMKEAYAKMIGVGISISFSTIDLESVAEEYEVSDLSAEDYICYAVGATPVTDIVKMNWDGTNLV